MQITSASGKWYYLAYHATNEKNSLNGPTLQHFLDVHSVVQK